MNSLQLWLSLRWLGQILLLWLVLTGERVLGLPVLSLVVLLSLSSQERGWRRYGLLIVTGLLLAALFMWSALGIMIVIWGAYFWFEYGATWIGSRTLRLLSGVWLGLGLMLVWESGWRQPRHLIYMLIMSGLVFLWLKRRPLWQLKSGVVTSGNQ